MLNRLTKLLLLYYTNIHITLKHVKYDDEKKNFFNIIIIGWLTVTSLYTYN